MIKAGRQPEAEKTDAADLWTLLNEPTMWLGAQDGRYLSLFTWPICIPHASCICDPVSHCRAPEM